MPLKGVVFDLDDTLYPEKDFVFSGYTAVGRTIQEKKGVDIAPELKERFQKGERGDLFTPTLKTIWPDVTEEDVKKCVAVYRSHIPTIEPYPDVIEVLTEIRQSLPLGLISDGHWQVQKNKLDGLGIKSLFKAIVFTDKAGREFWKPHPRPFRECARQLGHDPKNLVYIGDNPHKDFIGAREAGYQTLRLRQPGTLHEHVKLDSIHEADFEKTSLREVAAWIKDSRTREIMI